MAEVTFFHYQEKDSVLHFMDPRSKLVCFILLNFSIFRAPPLGVACILCIALAGIIGSKSNLMRFLKDVRVFLPIIAFVIVSRAVFQRGEQFSLIFGWTISREGLYSGLFFGLQFFTVILLGHLFIATTSPASVRDAVVWILRVLRIKKAGRIGTMIRIVLVFIPLLLDYVREILDAQKSRGFNFKKKLIRSSTVTGSALLRKTVILALEITSAMEARCYSEPSTTLSFGTSNARPGIIALCCIAALLPLFLERLFQ